MLNPSVGLRGLFELTAPFDTDIVTGVAYTCVAVRKFSDFRNTGKDPYTLVYKPKNISKEVFQDHEAKAVTIVSLQSQDGVMIYVPNAYISKTPSVDGVEYNVMLIGINLGIIPTYMDLTSLKERIVDVVKTTMGFSGVTATEMVASDTVVLSVEQHDVYESNRRSNIDEETSDYSRVRRLEAELINERQLRKELEDYISKIP